MTIPKELKKAISNLSSTEKDTLIFKLLKHDIILANRLFFELVDTKSVDERREEIQAILMRDIKIATKNFYSAGYLLMDVRSMSGMITEHVNITKDKYGEAWLNLWMLNNVLTLNEKNLKAISNNKDETFYIATVARVFKILMIIKKLHEDYLIEFEDGLQTLSCHIFKNPKFLQISTKHGLNLNWLSVNEIPENIIAIHKQIREKGLLK